MQFLARPNADHVYICIRRDGLGEINDFHAWNLWHKNFAAFHLLDARNDEPNALFQ